MDNMETSCGFNQCFQPVWLVTHCNRSVGYDQVTQRQISLSLFYLDDFLDSRKSSCNCSEIHKKSKDY